MAESLTYRGAGVDIDEAQRALRSVIPNVQSTYTDGVVAGIGGFGGLFKASFPEMERPILVSSIDGVGTKTKVAAMMGRYDGLGQDIVNHCINDILCQGARPLFFMDYFGTSRVNATVFEDVLQGMVQACKESDCALIGGETAEMPGVYLDEEVDVVGAIVGVVDADKRLPQTKPTAGDVLIGIASDGLHTNGFTLARRALFEVGGLSVRDAVPGLGTTIGDELLRPHRCYYKAVHPILQDMPQVYALAHITGGGLYDNLPRVIPTGFQVIIDRRSWSPLPIFRLIQESGNIADAEMYRVFNMGIGMVALVDKEVAAAVVQRLNQAGESAAVIGQVQKGADDVQIL